MSTTKPTRFENFVASLVIPCLVGCGFAFFKSENLAGWGLLITALLFRLTATVEARMAMIEVKMLELTHPHSDQVDKYGEDTHHLSLTTTELSEQSGWHSLTVFTIPFPHYVRERCWSGPPVHYETWEYDFKAGGDFLFHRLRDDHTDDLWYPRFDVVNGTVQEELIRRRDNESVSAFKVSAPEDIIAGFKRQIEWHEAHGAVRYFILSKLRPHGSWKREAEKLKEGIATIGAKAEALGAKMDEYGWYVVPHDAASEQKVAVEKLFSPQSLRSHGFRSYQDWIERHHIVNLLEPKPAPGAEPML
jgi:hypothetical protein